MEWYWGNHVIPDCHTSGERVRLPMKECELLVLQSTYNRIRGLEL